MKSKSKPSFLMKLGRGLRFKLFISIVLGFFTSVGIVGLLGVSGGFLTATAIAGLSLVNAEAFNVVIIPGLVRLLALTRTVGRYAERLSSHELTFRFLERLHLWIFDAYEAMRAREAFRIKSADVMERFTKDVHAIEHIIVRFLVPVGTAALMALLLLVTFAIFYPAGLWIALVLVLGLLAVLPLVLHVWTRASSVIEQDLQSKLRFGLIDLIDNLEDFSIEQASYSAHESQLARLEGDYAKVQVRLGSRLSLAKSLVIGLVGLLATALVVVLVVSPNLEGPFAVGLVFLLIGCGEVFAPIYQGFLDLPGSRKSLSRIKSLDQDEGQSQPVLKNAPKDSDLAIEIEGLNFAYEGGEPIFVDFSLRVKKGEHLVISGPSGGGKSTLVKILTGLESASGHLAIEEKLACALQDPYVFQKSLALNLSMGEPSVTRQKMLEIIEALELGELVASFDDGLETLMVSEGADLSGGQKRRLGLARALAQDADLVIVDEPTEGLDEEAGLRLTAKIRELCRGKTLLWVSHRKAEFGLFDRHISLGQSI